MWSVGGEYTVYLITKYSYSSCVFFCTIVWGGLVVLPCFDLCRSNSFHVNTQFGVGRHWWFNYPGPLLDVELEFACLSS